LIDIRHRPFYIPAMIRYECDKCGKPLPANDASRFIVKLEVYAAIGQLDLGKVSESDTQSQLQDVLEELRTADPGDVEDQTYRSFRFDVCDACRRKILAKPLG
jgi:hypothetical protein